MRTIILVGLLVFCSSAAAQSSSVYTWRDASGVTHYGDQSSAPNGATVRVVKALPPSRDAALIAPLLVPSNGANEASPPPDPAHPMTAAQSACRDATSNRNLYADTQKTVVRPVEGGGTAEMTAKERATALAHAESEVKAYCNVLGGDAPVVAPTNTAPQPSSATATDIPADPVRN